jgi:hypothetical protein
MLFYQPLNAAKPRTEHPRPSMSMKATPAFLPLLFLVCALPEPRAQEPAKPSLSLTFQGYEIARRDAAALLAKAPAKLDSGPLLLQAATLASQTRGRVVKMPALSLVSGARGSAQEGETRVDTQAVLGAGGGVAELLVALNSGPMQIQTACMVAVPGTVLLTAFEEAGKDTVTLVFAKVTKL